MYQLTMLFMLSWTWYGCLLCYHVGNLSLALTDESELNQPNLDMQRLYAGFSHLYHMHSFKRYTWYHSESIASTLMRTLSTIFLLWVLTVVCCHVLKRQSRISHPQIHVMARPWISGDTLKKKQIISQQKMNFQW